MSRIEWTDQTWNPVTGCSKVSAGCRNCYAERFAKRLQSMAVHKYRHGFNVTLHPDTLDEPKKWRKPRRVFVNSMSDLFHEDVPLEFIQRVFKVMDEHPQHQFQILTKRPERVKEKQYAYARETKNGWPDNVWIGTSIEEQKVLESRIIHLSNIDAKIRFLSIEPLIGKVSLDGWLDPPNLIHWVIVGGESGAGARPMFYEWAASIRDQCKAAGVPFFFKQWGFHGDTSRNGYKKDRKLDGKLYNEMPS